MYDDFVSHLPDADMQAVPRALMRAALRAREIARAHGTGIVILRDGVLVEEAVTDEDIEAFRREITAKGAFVGLK